ncbi:hypothetical protein, partial [Pseudoflavonifractor sp.]|uniref:hypothetical protein n=1 Tax=Pseudoflavonifractor sp. TaxID=1980281 RepID=UPI003D908440
KVVFNYAGSKNTVEIPLDPSVIDNVENIETGAVRLSSAQVHHVKTPLTSEPPKVRTSMVFFLFPLIYKGFRASRSNLLLGHS